MSLRPRRLRIGTVVYILIAIALALLVVAIYALWSSRDVEVSVWGFRGVSILLSLSYIVVGGFLAVKRPDNPLAWAILIAGIASSGQTFTEEIAILVEKTGSVPGWLGWASDYWWIVPATFAFTIIPMLFPDGKALSKYVFLAPVFFVVGMSSLDTDSEPGPTIILLWVGLIMVVTALVKRYRRGDNIVRNQLKIYFLLVTVQLLLVVSSATFPPRMLSVIAALAAVLAPLGIAAAVLRYGLYDIDLIINKALVYAGLTITLVVTYLGAVVVLSQATTFVAPNSDLALALSTLLVAALFRPARKRIQNLIDRRFYRARYDAARTVDDFAARLRARGDFSAIGNQVLAVVTSTIQPAHVSLWINPTTTRRTKEGVGS